MDGQGVCPAGGRADLRGSLVTGVRAGALRTRCRILVAGVGNVLRADDAYGVEVAHRLEAMELPDGVEVVETGIGGIALVQELQDGWDALIVADCRRRGRRRAT